MKPEVLSKQIGSLDTLVQALRDATPPSLAWQRQLITQLVNVDRLLQILRMSISMERPERELGASAVALHAGCRKASAAIAGSRADAITRAALLQMLEFAREIESAMAGN